MQFIDSSTAIHSNVMSVQKAIVTGRLDFKQATDIAEFAGLFRADREAAQSFDQRVEMLVDFSALSPAGKLDLLIDELLPRVFDAAGMAAFEQQAFVVRVTLNGGVERSLRFDGEGVTRVASDMGMPDLAFETDIETLLAVLRHQVVMSERADTDAVLESVELSAHEAAAIHGGMPADPPFDENSGDEGDEEDEGDEGQEGDEDNEGDEADEDDENDEKDEGDEGNEADEGNEGDEGDEDNEGNEGNEGN